VTTKRKTGREALTQAKRVVVKIGTNALTHATGRFHRPHFEKLARELLAVAEGRELIVVSSGAIALGVERLGLDARPKDIPGKQACAAVGQSRLMRAWEEALSPKVVAQVLLTHSDVQDRRRYLNARHALERLISHGVVPVINENDTVSVDEIKFGDNDTLAGLVAGLVQADVLIILSDVDGLYDADPRTNPAAKRIALVERVTPAMVQAAGGSGSTVGTGGMATKLKAAARVTELGLRCVIAEGHRSGALTGLFEGRDLGTVFEPLASHRDARAAWIAHALKPKGSLVVDDGARVALVEKKKSLLPSGVREVKGSFAHGDPVEIVTLSGAAFARGLVAYGADELRKIAGKKSSQIEAALGWHGMDEAVHRDDLVVLE
jgi:glutamate 5-kinase